jgi:hypothetical protein
MEIENDEELVIVDLGELSRTRFGASISSANLIDTIDGVRVHVSTEAVNAESECKRTNPSGTYVIYSNDGEIIGKTREVYRNKEEDS